MRWIIGCCLFMVLGTLMGHTAGVSAAFDRLFVEQGETVLYTITVENAQSIQPIQLPKIENLVRQPGPPTTREFVQINNGFKTAQNTFTFGLTTAHAGDLTVPPIKVNVDGKEFMTPGLRCSVTKATQHTNGVWLKIVTERDTYTLGEVIPLEVQLFSAFDIGSIAPPSLSLDGFIKGQAEPAQSGTTTIDGKQHVFLTYRMTATATRAGDLTLGPASTELMIIVRRPNFAFFGGEQRQITREAPGKVLHIIEPPLDGRPPGYTGAVGHFSARAAVTRTNFTAGDAVTLKTVVKGQGSFDSLPAPTLTEQPGIHFYAGTNAFTPEDSLGISGTKTFEQAVIVEDPAVTELKFEPFSYFDPQLHRYDTVKLAPIAIRVVPASGSPATAGSTAQTLAGNAAPNNGGNGDGLRPLKVEIGSPGSLKPGPADSSWFALVAISPLALYAGASVTLRLLAQRKKAIKPADTSLLSRDTLMAKLAAAADKGDSGAYYNALNQLLQVEIAPVAGVPPNSVTTEIVDSKLVPMGLPAEDGNRLKKLFEGVDEARFGGMAKPGALRAAMSDVEPTLNALRKLQWRN